MKLRTVAVLSMIGIATSIAPVWADAAGVGNNLSPQQRETALPRLEAKRTQLSQQMPATPKGVPLLQWHEKRNQLDDLINRVRSGEPVAPDEIDRVLQPTNR